MCYVLSVYEKVYYQFVTNNNLSFHLWWKENFLNHPKFSEYYEHVVFDNLSKNLIICPKHFDALMILNRLFTTVPPVIKIMELSAKLLMIIPTLCYLRLKRRLLAHKFLKNSKFCCRLNVNDFSRLIYPYLL